MDSVEFPFEGLDLGGESLADAVGVALVEFGVDLGEGSGFGGVDAEGSHLGQQRLDVGVEGLWPPGEGVVLIAQGGELAVFDDVGPVLDDPVAAGLLGGVGAAEAVDDSSRLQVRVEQLVDEAALVRWCGGEELLELVEAVDDGGGVEFGEHDRLRRPVVVEPEAGFEGAVHALAPLGGEFGAVGFGAVAGDGFGELVSVAPGGELADLVVVDLGADGIVGALARTRWSASRGCGRRARGRLARCAGGSRRGSRCSSSTLIPWVASAAAHVLATAVWAARSWARVSAAVSVSGEGSGLSMGRISLQSSCFTATVPVGDVKRMVAWAVWSEMAVTSADVVPSVEGSDAAADVEAGAGVLGGAQLAFERVGPL